MKKKTKKNQVKQFNFTDTKCAIPIHLDRFRVRTNDTKEIAMAVPNYQEGMLIFKVKTPHAKAWSEYFKDDLELCLLYHNQQIVNKWTNLK